MRHVLSAEDDLFEICNRFVESQIYKTIHGMIHPTPVLLFFTPLNVELLSSRSPLAIIQSPFREYLVWSSTGDVLSFMQHNADNCGYTERIKPYGDDIRKFKSTSKPMDQYYSESINPGSPLGNMLSSANM